MIVARAVPHRHSIDEGGAAADLGSNLRPMLVPVMRIRLLGGFEVRLGTDVVPIESGRVRALLGWLALHTGGPQPRQRIAGALWPDSTESQARTNLRNLLHQLRHAVPLIDQYLVSSPRMLAWRLDAPVETDVEAFERALHTADGGTDGDRMARLEHAVACYRGPLLPDHYEPWLDAHRERFARMHGAALEALLERHLERGDHRRALDVAEQIVRVDPLNERAHRARIACLDSLGDRAAAVRAYHECESQLEAELGVEPSRATREAYERALGMRTGAPALLDAAPAPAPVFRDSVLVGRTREVRALRRSWARTRESDARMVWVTGEPGIGKTRLVQSLAAWFEREGHHVVEARAYPTHGALGYGPIIAWLRSRALASAVADADDLVRRELGRLLPELRGPHAHADEEAYPEAERRQRIHDAVLRVLASSAAPSILIIDDLHWSDRETIDLLHDLVLRAERPFFVVATVRLEELEPEGALVRVGTHLSEADRLDRLELEPLDRDDTALLARHLSGRIPTDAEVDGLYRETEGNPLFIVETVRRDMTGEGTRRGDTNPRIRAVIEARLALLSREARRVMEVAATLGRAFTLPLLVRVSPLDQQATLRGVDEAWRRRLVRERDDGTYDFTHEKIREVAYLTTSPIRRRVHHERIAAILTDAWTGGTAGADITLDQIALHHDRSGAVADAVGWYDRAARGSVEISALDAASQLLDRALSLLPRLPPGAARDAQELDLRLAHGAVLVALQGYGRPAILATYERARALCAGLKRPVPAPVLRALGLAALAHGELDTGTRLAEEIAQGAAADGDAVARVEGEYLAGVMAFWRGELLESERRLRQALAWYDPDRHRDHVRLYAQDPRVVCLSRLAWTLWHRGRVGEALACRQTALTEAEAQGDPYGLCYALWFAQFIAVDQGDVERIRTESRRLANVAAAHGLHYVAAVADVFLGYVRALDGEARDGIARMRATIEDRRWSGMPYVLKPQTLLLIASAAAAKGDRDSSRAAIREAFGFLGAPESIWKAPLLMLEARLVGLEDRSGDVARPLFARALATARQYGSAWIELRVAIDRAGWCIEHGTGDCEDARHDLARALHAYRDGPPMPAMSAAGILLERLDNGEHS